jgi:hypothetical protein
MKLKIFSTGFRKILNTKFHEIRPVAAGLFHADRQTGRQNEANSRFSKICESA